MSGIAVFAHASCRTPIAACTDTLTTATVMRSAAWRLAGPSGRWFRPRYGSPARAACPDCGADVFPNAKNVRQVAVLPTRRVDIRLP